MDCLLFKDYVKGCKRNFNDKKYEQDIHYRAVLFQQYSRRYHAYVDKYKLANDYIKIAWEVKEYEKRIHSRTE